MSAQEAFGDSTFNVDGYLSNRPRYPDHLYDWVRRYVARHASLSPSSERVLLDLGCGPGFAAFPLLNDFARGGLIGVDTGKGMIEIAPKALSAWLEGTRYSNPWDHPGRGGSPGARFVVGSSDDLKGLVGDQEVDVVIAATAAHWFSYEETWRELTRVVKPGGGVVWWTYGEHYIPAHPELQDEVYAFMQGGEEAGQEGSSIGPYFPQPGRGYLTQLLQPVPFPHQVSTFEAGNGGKLSEEDLAQWDTESATRDFHPLVEGGKADLSWVTSAPTSTTTSSWEKAKWAEGPSSPPPMAPLAQPDRNGRVIFVRADPTKKTTTTTTRSRDLSNPLRLEQIWTWDQYEGYIRTSSALHAYLKAHPDEKAKEGKDDIANRFVKGIREKVLAERKKRREGQEVKAGWLEDEQVRLAWPLGIMAIAKKA